MLYIVHVLLGGTYVIVIVAVGVWAARNVRSDNPPEDTTKYDGTYIRKLFLAGPYMNTALVVISMTTSWVGVGFLNGTAETAYKDGILWCHASLGYAVSLFLGGRFFVAKIKDTESLTMLDPFQSHFGKWAALFLIFPCVLGELLWSSAVLRFLGSSVHHIVGADANATVWLMAASVVSYTMIGGMYSDMYTDIVQFFTAVFGVWICVLFCLSNEAVGKAREDWMGTVDSHRFWEYLDSYLMTVFGSIPCLVYVQHVLSCSTISQAKIMSYASACGSILLAVPAMLVGAAAKTTNFTIVKYNATTLLGEDSENVLVKSVVLLTPDAVNYVSLIAIAAAVMSSVDSSILCASTLLSHNIYFTLARPTAGHREVAAALRISIFCCTILSVIVAISTKSVYSLWRVSYDLVYVLFFPQFLGIFYYPAVANSYGSFVSFFVGAILRILVGEQAVGIPGLFPYLFKYHTYAFPYKTFCMAMCFGFLLLSSELARAVFERRMLPLQFDICHCFYDPKKQQTPIKHETQSESKTQPSAGSVMLSASSPTARSVLSQKSPSHSRTVSAIAHESAGNSMSPAEFMGKLRRRLKRNMQDTTDDQTLLAGRRRSLEIKQRRQSPRTTTPRGSPRSTPKRGSPNLSPTRSPKKASPSGTPTGRTAPSSKAASPIRGSPTQTPVSPPTPQNKMVATTAPKNMTPRSTPGSPTASPTKVAAVGHREVDKNSSPPQKGSPRARTPTLREAEMDYTMLSQTQERRRLSHTPTRSRSELDISMRGKKKKKASLCLII